MNALDLPRNGLLFIRNAFRSLRRKGLETLVVPVDGSFPERAPRRTPLPFPLSMLSVFPSELSLEEMQDAMDVITADERVQAVVFRIHNL
ncbi:MAG: hypothetical protein PVH50_10235, partial [Anaerolineae bacterium]